VRCWPKARSESRFVCRGAWQVLARCQSVSLLTPLLDGRDDASKLLPEPCDSAPGHLEVSTTFVGEQAADERGTQLLGRSNRVDARGNVPKAPNRRTSSSEKFEPRGLK
jgi:hypothetical protein